MASVTSTVKDGEEPKSLQKHDIKTVHKKGGYKMAVTKIADVIVPEIFSPYVIRKSTELSRLIQSGIYTTSTELNNLITGGGRTITMPKWNDLTGDDEIISESSPLTPSKLSAEAEVAVALYRGKAWGATELSGCFAGSDPMEAIGTLVAEYWNRKEQKTLISTLEGCFAASNMSGLVSGDGTTAISAESILDAKQLLGDAADKLTALAIHSAVFTQLQKLNLIKYIPNARGEINIPTYLGYNLIVDDGLPVVAATTGENATPAMYTSYLFAAGSVARGIGNPPSLTQTETDRDSMASTDYLINRRAYVLHPIGMKWKGVTVVGETPTNAELALGTNWTRVADVKQMGMVKLVHKLAD